MLKWIAVIVLIPIALLAIAALAGLALPKAHVASRSRHVKHTPDRAFTLISGVDHYTTWRTDMKSIERLPDDDGHIAWRENGSNGPITYRAVESTAPRRFVAEISDRSLPYGGRWEYDVTPNGTGSNVTITERGEIYNPVFRSLARFVFGYTGSMEKTLDALEKA